MKECPCPPEFYGDQEIESVCPYCNDTGIIEEEIDYAIYKEGSKGLSGTSH